MLIFFFGIFFSIENLYAQQVELKGVVRDSLHQALPHTNIIASPLGGEASINFAISDEQGRYRLDLTSEKQYRLEVIHLGFSKLVDTLSISENTEKDFILFRTVEALEEIIIEQEMAVIVKEDTITYRVEQFKTGEERKLREVLKKLPGVEVDRAGNVTINGKQVTKLMVEGKTFFTGDAKLGVNNIPADAVEEVQALDNYSEVAFLKDLSDSDQMALNIKLKEGKKNFMFGDLEAGAGIEDRYLFDPTLFYYSPKTAVNVIGDFNNIGEKSFTMSDYINFEGGYTGLMEGSAAVSNIFKSDFAQFLGQEDFVYNRNEFGAGSLSREISESLQLDAYSIVSGGRVETMTTNEIRYLTETGLDEFRETSLDNKLFFTLSKLKLRYRPDAKTDVIYDATVKTSEGDAEQELLSQSPEGVHQTRALQDPENVELNQFLSYNKQFSYEHTSTLTATYTYEDSRNRNDWFFDRPVFSGIIPFEAEGDIFHLLQHSSSRIHDTRIDLKHYWVLDNLNHLYPKAGINLFDQEFGTLDYQLFEDGSSRSFQDSGFNNDLGFRLWDVYTGLEYKVKLGDLIVKPELTFHQYFWRVSQFGKEIVDREKSVLLPALMLKYEFNSSEHLNFDYNLKSGFDDASSYANRLRLESFNRISMGNEELENALSHSFALRYYQFNMYRGLFVNASLSYTHRLRSIKRSTRLQGIDQISSLIYSDQPEDTYFGAASAAKQWGKLKFSLSGSMSLSDYSRIINDISTDYHSRNFGYTIKTETRFKKLPNIELGYRQDFSKFSSDEFNSDFVRIDPYFELEYDFLNDFILKADYTYNYYQDKDNNETNHFQLGNASLFYNQEDSPWSFEINVRNLFDVDYRNSSSFSEFLITDQRIFIQPRTLMLKIGYKL